MLYNARGHKLRFFTLQKAQFVTGTGINIKISILFFRPKFNSFGLIGRCQFCYGVGVPVGVPATGVDVLFNAAVGVGVPVAADWVGVSVNIYGG